MHKVLRVCGIVLLLILLATIRFFEEHLFYDPLLNFFKGDYLNNITPQFHLFKLLIHTALRFFCNTLISLLILFVAFQDKSILKFAGILYSILFIVLMLIFIGMLLQVNDIQNFIPLFYVRRFLIQPVLIILLLPAFYYYKKQQ